MSQYYNLGRLAGKVGKQVIKKAAEAIKSVKPTLGKSKTQEYLKENQRKLAQAKVKLKAMQTVDKDVKKGYDSVMKKGEEQCEDILVMDPKMLLDQKT